MENPFSHLLFCDFDSTSTYERTFQNNVKKNYLSQSVFESFYKILTIF